MEANNKLRKFRASLYELFSKRKDAIMELLDALTSCGHRCNSVVELSNSVHFKRQYSSITDAIADGLPEASWTEIRRLVYEATIQSKNKVPHRFIIDCTSEKRPYANKLPDRTITHFPNPAPGNKPICVGHQYSILSMLPNDIDENQKHWLVPLSAKRVSSKKKGNELGMQQIVDCIDELEIKNDLSISIGDSLYGTERCRKIVSEQANLVHIFRLNSKRNMFLTPTEPAGPTGRKKEFGAKMNLGVPGTHVPCDREAEVQQLSKKGKMLIISIKCWDNMLLRGSRTFRSSQHPLNVIQVCVKDSDGKDIFKRPLWLGVLGERRGEISLEDSYKNYRSRYDTEHLFRFGKQRLLFGTYQTADLEHAELWWQFCLLAYTQLYLAKSIVPATPQPWERYLSEYKNINEQTITTPSQTQRGFSKVLDKIGTLAKDCVPRGKPRGRMLGELQEKKLKQPVVFKSKKVAKKKTNEILSGSENLTINPNPETTDSLIKSIQDKLVTINLSLPEFTKMLMNTT